MLKFDSFDKPPTTTLFSNYQYPRTVTVAVYSAEVTRLLLLLTGFFFAFACLFFFYVSSLQPYTKDVAPMYDCICPVHASHHFVVLPYQPAYESRSFSALFLCVPHRTCTGFCFPNRPNTTAAAAL